MTVAGKNVVLIGLSEKEAKALRNLLWMNRSAAKLTELGAKAFTPDGLTEASRSERFWDLHTQLKNRLA